MAIRPSRKRLTIHEVKAGMKVYWHDPDRGACSRWDRVAGVEDADGEVDSDTIVLLKSGTEVFAHELSPEVKK